MYNFVYHHWGLTSILCPLSYPLRPLKLFYFSDFISFPVLVVEKEISCKSYDFLVIYKDKKMKPLSTSSLYRSENIF